MPASKVLRILLIENKPADVATVEARLKDSVFDFEVEYAENLATAVQILQRQQFDVLLLDMTLPDSQGLSTFQSISTNALETPVVILSGDEDEELAVEALRAGAQDYLLKGEVDAGSLTRAIRFAIERSRRQRMEKELLSAAAIQKGLFPRPSMKVMGFDVAGRCVAAAYVGGDYFDFFSMGKGRLGIVIADAAGNGIGPAMVMTETRAIVRALAFVEKDVGKILTGVNYVLAKDLGKQTFVTLFLVSLDHQTGALRFAAAGHQGHILNEQGHQKRLLKTDDPPLGVSPNHQYSGSEEIEFEVPDSLALFTNGLYECVDGSRSKFGHHRLMAAFHGMPTNDATSALCHVFNQVDEFLGETRSVDDMTAVIVQRSAATKSESPQTSSRSPDIPTGDYRHFELAVHDKYLVLNIHGGNILTTDQCMELQSELLGLVNPDQPKHFIINFGGISRFSSEAISVLLRLRMSLDAIGQQVILCEMRPELREAFQALNLDGGVLNIAASLENAERLVKIT